MPRPKFSLLSLLLFSLLTASAMTLYFHYPAWRAVRVICEGVRHFSISHDGTCISVVRSDKTISIFDADGNVLDHLTDFPDLPQWAHFRSTRFLDINFQGKINNTTIFRNYWNALWDMQNRRWIKLPGNASEFPVNKEPWEAIDQFSNSLKHVFTTTRDNDQTLSVLRLYEFPDWNLVTEWKSNDFSFFYFSEDATKAYIEHGKTYEIWDLIRRKHAAGATMPHPHFRANFTHLVEWKDKATQLQVSNAITRDPLFPAQLGTLSEKEWLLHLAPRELIVLGMNGRHLQEIRLWDLENEKHTQTISVSDLIYPPFPPSEPMPWLEDEMFCLYVSNSPLIEPNHVHAWDRKSGVYLGDWQCSGVQRDKHFRIVDAEGNLYAPPNKQPFAKIHGKYQEFDFFPNQDRLLGKTVPSNENESNELHLIMKTRPEPWWGLAYLPEFWTTLLLAALFLWNLFRKPK